MEIKCGTDIIEIDRIKDSIEELGDKFLDRIFTKKEIEYCGTLCSKICSKRSRL